AYRTFIDAGVGVEISHHRHVSLAGFELYFLNEVKDRSVAKTRLARSQLLARLTDDARQPTLRLAIVRLRQLCHFRIRFDAIVTRDRARGFRIHAPASAGFL